MGQRLPDFFIAGAPKAGTDALFYDLGHHPEIYMSPIKEPCYFSSEIRLENFEPSQRERRVAQRESVRQYLNGPMTELRFGGVISEWEDYLRLFAGATNQKVVGEGSVCYLWSRTAASAIATRVPDAKIIIVLMDPAERAFAQYLKSVSNGSVTHSFREHLQTCLNLRDMRLSIYHPFLEFGLYAEQVKRYKKAFPEKQLHISFCEEAVGNPSLWFQRILEFLGVDPAFVPHSTEESYSARVPRFVRLSQKLRSSGIWSTAKSVVPSQLLVRAKQLAYRQTNTLAMSSFERAMLQDYYRDDVLALETLLNKDLNRWLS